MSAQTSKLNTNQLNILLITHKFRFITAPYYAKHRQKDKSVVTRSLQLLHKRGYLDRFYDKSYKLLGKPARYYLTKQGIAYLKKHTDIEPKTLNLHYKNTSLTKHYIEHCLLTYGLYLQLLAVHPDHDIFSRIEMSRVEHFPIPQPDLYIQMNYDDSGGIFIEIHSDNQLWAIKKRIDTLIQHQEDGEWYEPINYPRIDLYTADQRSKKSLEKYIEDAFDNNYIEDEMTIEVKILS